MKKGLETELKKLKEAEQEFWTVPSFCVFTAAELKCCF
jgi:hypothetical protein